MSILNKFLLLLFIVTVSTQQDASKKPAFRVVAPNYLCNDPSNSNGNKTDSSNKLNIVLQTKEGKKLKYKIAIDFDLLDGFKNQRHTLSIWKNVRELEAKFSRKEVTDEISLKNQIEIDSMELTPLVKYTFRIVGYDENNQASDEQNFSLTYKGNTLQAANSNVGEGVSLLLYGPEIFYSDLELLVVADVIFCDPVNDYYYKWKINGITSDAFTEDYLSTKGSILQLPSGVLDDDKLYEFSVTIFNNVSLAMATIALPLKVSTKEVETMNIPSDCNVGVNREIPFVTRPYRNSMTENVDIKWICSVDETECQNIFINSSNSLRVMATFPNEGMYTLKADIVQKGTTKSSNTKVLADPKVIPHVEIKFFPQQPISVMESTEIVATIMDLVPKCVAYWNIVTDGDFAKAKNENLMDTGMISIKDYEEHFLQELVDYDNNTLSKDTSLKIPANSLYPDSKYKFRLNILCPEPITDLMSPNERKNVTTYFDIVLETNGPPTVLPLLVTPFSGIPMKDEFTFKTGTAKERKSDYPLKYSFGYQVGDLMINIGTFYEYQVARTQLPYADGILTFMQVTDNNNASTFVKGPKIKANLPYSFSQQEIEFKLSEVQGTLKRTEYMKTLNSATVLILTTRKYAADDAQKYEEKVYDMLKTELQSLKSTKSSTFVHQQNIKEFVKMIKNLLSIMTVYDETFVEDILSLTESQARRAKRMILSNSMRNRSAMTHDPEYIKNVLSLSDILVSSSNTDTARKEKKKYVEKIHMFIASLCQDPHLNVHVIQSKFATFEVSKIYTRQLFIQPQKFPNDTANVMFSYNANLPYKFVCIGKVKLLIDMFDDSTKENIHDIVYETRILDDDQSGKKVVIKSENVGEFVVMEMTIKNGNANEQSCLIWMENRWGSSECEQQAVNQSRIVCKCKTFSDSAIIKYQKLSIKEVGTEKSTTSIIATTKSSIMGSTSQKDENLSTKSSTETSKAGNEDGKTKTTTFITNVEVTTAESRPIQQTTAILESTTFRKNSGNEDSKSTVIVVTTENPQVTSQTNESFSYTIEVTTGISIATNTEKGTSINQVTTASFISPTSEMVNNQPSSTISSSSEIVTASSIQGTSSSVTTTISDGKGGNNNEVTTISTMTLSSSEKDTSLDKDVTTIISVTSVSTESSTTSNSEGTTSSVIPSSTEKAISQQITTISSLEKATTTPVRESPINTPVTTTIPANPTETSIEKITKVTESQGNNQITTKSTNEVEKSTLSTTAVSKQTQTTTMNAITTTERPKQQSTEKVVTEKATTEKSSDKTNQQTTTSLVTKENQQQNSTAANVVEANFGLNIWFVILMLCLFFGVVIILVLIHKCRRISDSYINLPMRQATTNIKYAKYHDEFIMRG